MIYIASPYSHPDPAVRQQQFEDVCRFAAAMMEHGQHVFSPIAHSHPLALHGRLPTDWVYWEALNRFWIGVCEEVVVLCIDGWRESNGVQSEIKIAGELKKPVTYFTPGNSGMIFNMRLGAV